MARIRFHLDEARANALRVGEQAVAWEDVDKLVIVDDLYGRIRVVIWPGEGATPTALTERLEQAFALECAPYWAGVLVADRRGPLEDQPLWDAAWSEGVRVDEKDRLRINDRHRSRTAWFLPIEKREPKAPSSPPVVAFHSFKGGVGRTTALATYAVRRARMGENVVVVDLDLDAPGVGRLLDADGQGAMARWGVVDFLLEAGEGFPLEDYFHTVARDHVTGEGRIQVFPAGALDDTYLTKLGRVDFDVGSDPSRHPLFRLMDRIREELSPSVILVDGRAGLSPAAGLLLGGLAHHHVLVATTNPQSLAGLERVVRHLGYEQARRERLQRDCVVVQAMVPDSVEVGAAATSHFAACVEQMFRDGYYAEDAGEGDELWSLADLDSSVAPHVPVPIAYRQRFAFFDTVDSVVDSLLADEGHTLLAERLDQRLRPAVDNSETDEN